jgi:hypothetical protein
MLNVPGDRRLSPKRLRNRTDDAPPRGLPALATPREHHINAVVRALIEIGDDLRRILQITIHHHDVAARAAGDSRRDRRVLAEIAAEPQAPDRRHLPGELADHRPRPTAAAMLDENDLVVGG